MESLFLEFVIQEDFSRHGLCGLVCPGMLVFGLELASDVNRVKFKPNVKSPVPSIPVPGRRFSHIHLDLTGPLPSSQGYSYILTMIDRTL